MKVGSSFFLIIFLITFRIKQANLSLILYFNFSRRFLRSILSLVLFCIFRILSTLILFSSGPKSGGAEYSEETMAVFSSSLHLPILFLMRKSVPQSLEAASGYLLLLPTILQIILNEKKKEEEGNTRLVNVKHKKIPHQQNSSLFLGNEFHLLCYLRMCLSCQTYLVES